MRWSIIQLIWFRELRDQLRDRRTMITIVVLPLLLYPILSFLLMQVATQLLSQQSVVGFSGGEALSKNFPHSSVSPGLKSVVPACSWFMLTPLPTPLPVDRALGAAIFARKNHLSMDYHLLMENGEIPAFLQHKPKPQVGVFPGTIDLQFQFLEGSGDEALHQGKVDLVVAAAPDFMDQLIRGERPRLELIGRENDDRSRRAAEQMSILLRRWNNHLKEVRLQRHGLPQRFDEPFSVCNANRSENEEILAAESLLDLMVRTFPFLLVMWSLVGALHPAIDLCAGEKERGTMETLLISPAGRAEIVYGKFLTIWVFSAVTAVMHLLSMAISTWQLREHLPQGAVTLPAMFWCLMLVLPLSALFSAVSLSIGAYARSSKEGQYYLMPLFWVMMPLILLTFLPHVELNQFYSMVPVTGVALLMQRLMIAPSLDTVPWLYFIPVLASMMLWSWLALRWAIWQFQREEVLFRSAERLHLGLMISQLFRRKGPMPTLAQALMCFGLLFGLRWMWMSQDTSLPLLVRNCIVFLAFVAAPPLFMGLIATEKPRSSLGLKLPHPGYLLAAALLLPLAELAHHLMVQFPDVAELFRSRRSFVEEAWQQVGQGSIQMSWAQYVLVLGLLPAVCKELAFRGFILNGLRHRLSFWPAILLSSLLFAFYHMNFFALIPFLMLGVICGVLAVRSGSLLPGIILHTGCNILLMRGPLVGIANVSTFASSWALGVLILLTLFCTMGVGYLFWRLQPSDQQ